MKGKLNDIVRVPWDAEEYSRTAKCTTNPVNPQGIEASGQIHTMPTIFVDNKDRIIMWHLPGILPYYRVSGVCQ